MSAAESMSARNFKLKTRFELTGVFILIAGVFAAGLVYRRESIETRGDDPYTIDVTASKAGRREMEVIGGESNVIAAEFADWFAGLWHGKKLAYTLAVLATGGGAVCFSFARLLTFQLPSDPSAKLK